MFSFNLKAGKLSQDLLALEFCEERYLIIFNYFDSMDQLLTSDVYISMFVESGAISYDNCKDVDVVTVIPEYTTLTAPASSVNLEITYDGRVKDHSFSSSRIRSVDDSSFHYDSGTDSMSVSSSVFEFQKSDHRAPQRVPLAPFSKPAPSKWDDAQKWIASPTSGHPKNGQVNQGIGLRKFSQFGYGSRPSSTKVVVEVPDQRMVPYEEPDTKRIDSSQAKKETGVQKSVSWDSNQFASESYSKPVPMMENCIGESASKIICFSSISLPIRILKFLI